MVNRDCFDDNDDDDNDDDDELTTKVGKCDSNGQIRNIINIL